MTIRRETAHTETKQQSNECKSWARRQRRIERKGTPDRQILYIQFRHRDAPQHNSARARGAACEGKIAHNKESLGKPKLGKPRRELLQQSRSGQGGGSLVGCCGWRGQVPMEPWISKHLVQPGSPRLRLSGNIFDGGRALRRRGARDGSHLQAIRPFLITQIRLGSVVHSASIQRVRSLITMERTNTSTGHRYPLGRVATRLSSLGLLFTSLSEQWFRTVPP